MAALRASEQAWGTPPDGGAEYAQAGRLWTAAPGEASDGPGREDGLPPYESHPRGNPPLEQVDLERGEENLTRVLGW
jgi:hypothetical protein